MYQNYPHDNHLQHEDTAMRAVEGSQTHLYLVPGSVTISCTANTPVSQSVTFARPFTPNTTPTVIPGISALGNTSSVIKNAAAVSVTNTGFTIQLLTDTTQNITVSWIALGKAE